MCPAIALTAQHLSPKHKRGKVLLDRARHSVPPTGCMWYFLQTSAYQAGSFLSLPRMFVWGRGVFSVLFCFLSPHPRLDLQHSFLQGGRLSSRHRGRKHLLEIPSSILGVAGLPSSCRWLYSQLPCGHMAIRGLLVLITASSLCLFKNQKADRLLMVYLY